MNLIRSQSNQEQRGVGLLDTVLLVSSVALVAWGGIYLGHYGGRFDGNEFDAIPSRRVVSAGPKAPPESPEVKKGRLVYTGYCAACHGAKGEGGAAPGTPPLDKSEWVTSPGPGGLLRILCHAVEGPITVAKQEYNNPGMIAWGATLKPDEIAAVATFIRQAWSNKASPVSVDQVNTVLTATKDRSSKWTVAELIKVPETDGSGAAGAAELTPEQLRDKLKALPPEKLKDLLKDLGK